jgi:hypothetical protein
MIIELNNLIQKGDKVPNGYKWITCDCNGAVWVWQDEPFRERASGEWVLKRKGVDTDNMGIEYDVIWEFDGEVENWDKLKAAINST